MYLGVAQMVERYLGVVEAAGSNPVTQTKTKILSTIVDGIFVLYYSFFIIHYSSFIKWIFVMNNE